MTGQHNQAGIDQEVRSLIASYGVRAVTDAIARQKPPRRRGRRRIGDWSEIHDIIMADAREWLDGGDPFKSRSPSSIAREYARKFPGQSEISTRRRLMRKLSRRRELYTFMGAALIVLNERRPLADYLKALRSLAEIGPERFREHLRRVEETVVLFRDRLGPPPDDFSFDDIVNVLDESLNVPLGLGLGSALKR